MALLPAEGEDSGPLYSVSEVAFWFFGRSAHWVRWIEKAKTALVREDGSTLGRNAEGGARQVGELRHYTLGDVAEMADMLLDKEVITHAMWDRACAMIAIQGDIHKVFDMEYDYQGETYDLSTVEVAEMAGRKVNWVRVHAVDLGGVKRRWADDSFAESWRFPSEGMDERIYKLIGPIKTAEEAQDG